MMGTRCGSIDPAIIPYLMGRTGMSAQDIDTYMNKKSGMLGISGVSSDFRDAYAAAKQGNERAALARRCFAIRSASSSAPMPRRSVALTRLS